MSIKHNMDLPPVEKEGGILSTRQTTDEISNLHPGYDVYEVDYTDETTTTEYYRTYVDHDAGIAVSIVFDIDYCDYIDQPNLSNVADGRYKYIVYGDGKLRIAPFIELGNGCKHIQLSTSVGSSNVYIGGKLIKDGYNYRIDTSSGYCSSACMYVEDQDEYKRKLDSALSNVLNNHNLPTEATVSFEGRVFDITSEICVKILDIIES